jgi:hypothetical protein
MLTLDNGTTIDDADPVIFNAIEVNNSAGNITYDDTTGTITIVQNGVYLVTWTLAVDGATGSQIVRLNLSQGGSLVMSYTSTATQTLMSGSALIEVTGVLDNTLQLVNDSGDTVEVTQTGTYQGNLTITRVGV